MPPAVTAVTRSSVSVATIASLQYVKHGAVYTNVNILCPPSNFSIYINQYDAPPFILPTSLVSRYKQAPIFSQLSRLTYRWQCAVPAVPRGSCTQHVTVAFLVSSNSFPNFIQLRKITLAELPCQWLPPAYFRTGHPCPKTDRQTSSVTIIFTLFAF